MTRWLALATMVAVTLLMAFDRGRTLELPVRDFVMRLMPSQPARSTVVVAIDERSLSEIGVWPWPRDVLAEITGRIADAGAAAVIFDILLTDPRPGDDVLAKAMRSDANCPHPYPGMTVPAARASRQSWRPDIVTKEDRGRCHNVCFQMPPVRVRLTLLLKSVNGHQVLAISFDERTRW